MKKNKWSLFTKFALGISFMVIFFGLLNALIVRNSVSSSLNNEFERRGYFISRALAEQSVAYMGKFWRIPSASGYHKNYSG